MSQYDNGYRANNNAAPPQPNPVLTAYESYCQSTPLVTRYVLNTIMITFLCSFFFSPAILLANIPIFTVFRFQLYRILTSPLLCENFLNLIFAFMGFLSHGVKLEQSLGSSMFCLLFFTLTIATNVLFLIITILLWGLTNQEAHLSSVSMGIWVVLLGIIAVECAEAPEGTKRKLFVLEIKAIYYPLVLLAIFTMLSGPRLSYFLAVGIGYAMGYGKLDKFKVSVERVRKWENREQNGCLSGFINRPGFITMSSASGPNAWLVQEGSGDGNGSGSAGAVRAPEDPAAAPSFPSSGGRSLGGSSTTGLLSRARSPKKKTPEERAALLERAAERRRQQQSGEGESVV